MPSILAKCSGPLLTPSKRLQLRPRSRPSLPLGINDLLHADEGLVNPLRDGPLTRLLFRLAVRSGNVGGLLDIPVGLELHRVCRWAVQKREEGIRAEGEPRLGWLGEGFNRCGLQLQNGGPRRGTSRC